MPVIEESIYIEQGGTISFDNHELGQKARKSDLEYQGDMYKIETCNEITEPERNDTFVCESVPGAAVKHLKVMDEDVELTVEGSRDVQIAM